MREPALHSCLRVPGVCWLPQGGTEWWVCVRVCCVASCGLLWVLKRERTHMGGGDSPKSLCAWLQPSLGIICAHWLLLLRVGWKMVAHSVEPLSMPVCCQVASVQNTTAAAHL